MIRVYLELSGEAPTLGSAEATAAVGALGGRPVPGTSRFPGLWAFDVPGLDVPPRLAGRLALARRVLIEKDPRGDLGHGAGGTAARGRSVAVRRLGRPSSADDPAIHEVARRYVAAGGRVDLERPDDRWWLVADAVGRDHVLEEVAAVDRSAAGRRRMPLLPFQRPVSLPPRLARAAVNLARVRPGDRVLDPFLGTGALLGEAGLLGAHLYGIDRDPEMVRGAIRNLEYLGVTAEELVVGDAGTVDVAASADPWDAVVTDPPYGRSSSTGGESADHLVARVVPRWGERLRPDGRVVLVVPQGAAELPLPWEAETRVAVRVHRSLTREFRVYLRPPGTARP